MGVALLMCDVDVCVCVICLRESVRVVSVKIPQTPDSSPPPPRLRPRLRPHTACFVIPTKVFSPVNISVYSPSQLSSFVVERTREAAGTSIRTVITSGHVRPPPLPHPRNSWSAFGARDLLRVSTAIQIINQRFYFLLIYCKGDYGTDSSSPLPPHVLPPLS